MSDFARYRTEVLPAPPPLRTDPYPRLAVSGCTVLTYSLARVEEGFGNPPRPLPDDPVIATYEGVFWTGADFGITALKSLGRASLPAHASSASAASWTSAVDVDVRTHYLWATPRHVLAVTAWPLAATRGDGSRHPIDDPIALRGASLETILAALATFADPELQDRVARLVALDLGLEPESVTPVRDALAIDIWDLAESPVLQDGAPYSAPAHVPDIAYEIGALLSRTTSHVIEDGRWADQAPDRVFTETRYAYSFLTIGAAFANAHTCVEVSDVVNAEKAELRDYKRRLGLLGYDSTAVFVWTMEILRGAVFRDLNAAYRDRVTRLLHEETAEPTDSRSVAENVTRDRADAEALGELPRLLREGRHRAMSEDVSALRDTTRDLEGLERRIAAYESLARSHREAREELRSHRINLIFSLFGVAIAIAGLTQIADLVYSWYQGGDVTRPAITLALLALVAVPTLVVWRRLSDGGVSAR